MRETLSLSGTWGFQLDPSGTLSVESLQPDREIPVPMPWQVVFPELQRFSGFAWYRRSVEIAPAWLDGDLLIHFGAVDYWCQVFVNGEMAGVHEGGYTPFTLSIGSLVKPGENEIAVRVFDAVQTEISIPRWPASQNGTSPGGPPFEANDIPHGKQEWYINAGGIWQDVTLSSVPRRYISHARVSTDINTGEASFRIEIGGTGGANTADTLHIAVEDAGGVVAAGSAPIQNGLLTQEITVKIESPHLWSDTDPHLYVATVRLQTAHGEDEVSVRFGFREIATRGRKLLLNGEPIFLLSVLDQDLYPDTIYTVPSEDYLRDQFRKVKELGFNCLRCHIKPPDPLYLDLADELGLLVWAEVPSWRTFHLKGTVHANQLDLEEAVKSRVEKTLEETIRRDFNHPSIIIWTIVNEDWGTSLPLSADDRVWVRQMYTRCKELDPTRLVVDNSACPHHWGPNFHVKSDLDDFHIYANIPDQARRFTQIIEQFALRPAWTYSTFGDAERTGEEPLVLSEFGNWGLPSLELLRRAEGKDPHWFDLGPWWSEWEGEPGWPAGADERFVALGLDSIWSDYEAFATATQWHQYAAMKFEIEVMRRQPSLEGYVVTELADTYWESNGVLDFYRNPKSYHNLFHNINSPDVIVPQLKRFAYWGDQEMMARLFASHYSGQEWEGASAQCSINDAPLGGRLPVPATPRGVVSELQSIQLKMPRVDDTVSKKIDIEVDTGDGKTLARNSIDVLMLPESYRAAQYKGKVAVIALHGRELIPVIAPPSILPEREGAPVAELPEAEPFVPPSPVAEERPGLDLERTLAALGYNTLAEISGDTRVAVTNYPDAELLKWVRQGGDLLYLNRGPSPFFWTQTRGVAYGGGWITAFSWLRTAVHKRLKVSNPLGLPFMHIMPTLTILGLPVEDKAIQGDFLSGMIAGWVRHPAIHTVQFRLGRGRVIMTTFALEESLNIDPVATAMFHDLLEYLVSDDCNPTLALN